MRRLLVLLRVGVVAAVVAVGVLLSWVAGASAVVGPQWSVSSASRPTNFRPGGDPGGDEFVVLVTNTGGAASSGPVTITDELPEGLVGAPGVSGEDELLTVEGAQAGAGANFSGDCSETGAGGVSCTYGGVVVPDDTLAVVFPVGVTAAGGTVLNRVTVSGGGAASAVMQTPTLVSPTQAGFGVSAGSATTTLSSVQAGAHPDITTTGAFNTTNSEGATAGNLKNIVGYEPPGFALDLAGTPTCPPDLFLSEECPAATQVGVITLSIDQGFGAASKALQPVYDLAPEPGEIGKLGFNVGQFRYEGDITVRPAGEVGEYGGKVTFYNASGGLIDYDGFSLTIWGVPANPIHDPIRWSPGVKSPTEGHFGVSSGASETPFFTNPTSCGSGPLQAEFKLTSWQHPQESENPEVTPMAFGPIVGCEALVMEPSLTAETTSNSAYAPTGFDLATTIPQTYDDAGELATPTLRREVVTLPEGVTINPSSGAGLAACSEAQYAEEETQYRPGHGCPAESKLATVRIKTPLLEEEVTGSVYLAEPAPRQEAGKNPFGSLLALYLIARIPNRGVLVKAPGEVQANATTGQLTTSFEGAPSFEAGGTRVPASEGLPPLPFSIATFQFNQGANAPLVTPPTCGEFEVKAQLTPWSATESTPPLEPLIPPFPITTNCPTNSTPPFNPHVTAYPIHANAGAYSPFYIRLSRNDGEQEITGFSSQLPPGLTGDLTGVEQCPEADVALARTKTGVQEEAQPSCPAGSEIGHTLSGAGVGPVLVYAPGKLYLGGPFEGAPFSVVSITSAHVGPFDLGTVVVHLPLQINPETAVVSIPAGAADQIPHIIKGIVIHVREIRVYVDREKFMLNPTNCNPLTFTATIIGSGQNFTSATDDDPATVNDPFQAADCASLKFSPKLAVSTGGHASKANGAGLVFKISYPANAIGSQSWFNEAKFDIPRQLPARLTTLQKACLAKTFETNRTACPAASVIGHAVVHTPILPVPLEGPVYFVSYGGAKFPDAVLLLQGYGITIELHGETFIDNKTGVTSATFKNLPDVPFQSIEVKVPTGPYSEFGTNLPTKDHYNLCNQKLTMPTLFKASNGLEIHQNTPLTTTSCTKKHKKTKKHHTTKHHH